MANTRPGEWARAAIAVMPGEDEDFKPLTVKKIYDRIIQRNEFRSDIEDPQDAMRALRVQLDNYCVNPKRPQRQGIGIYFRRHHTLFSLEPGPDLAAYISNTPVATSTSIVESPVNITYLFTWKENHYPELYDDYEQWLKGKLGSINWSAGKFKLIPRHARIFLMRQGENPGIIGAGRTVSDCKMRPHSDGTPGKMEPSNDLEIQELSHPDSPLISLDELLTIEDQKRGLWLYGSSGKPIPRPAAEKLEVAWRKAIQRAGSNTVTTTTVYADELPPGTYPEGLKKTITVNAYERSQEARDECVAHHGTRCHVCKMSFDEVYGKIGQGFIHVHHLKQIARIGREYQVDPVNDLRPVCPNCHAMLHRNRDVPLSIEELKAMLRR